VEEPLGVRSSNFPSPRRQARSDSPPRRSRRSRHRVPPARNRCTVRRQATGVAARCGHGQPRRRRPYSRPTSRLRAEPRTRLAGRAESPRHPSNSFRRPRRPVQRLPSGFASREKRYCEHDEGNRFDGSKPANHAPKPPSKERDVRPETREKRDVSRLPTATPSGWQISPGPGGRRYEFLCLKSTALASGGRR
jgi:hypothetical protein